MRICYRGLNRVQIVNADGDMRICSWIDDGKNGHIGKLTEHSLYDIYHGSDAQKIREAFLDNDYSICSIDNCPYVANNNIDEISVNIDKVPEWPEQLALAFENVCNYHCTSCNVYDTMQCNANRKLDGNYEIIENEIRKALPHIKKISANGMGELFASPRTLKLLSEWKPLAPKEECSVEIETNGSLFNETNWKKIENLGQYDLSVCLTVMSFDEKTYQVLSGTKLPVSNIESNLRFIKSLRNKGIINYLELATVYQERNFRTMPDLVRRFLNDYGADCVRLRPYAPWDEDRPDLMWFKDVRNKYHPYNQEFLDVWSDPIFKNKKVWDQGGGISSEIGESPYVLEHKKVVKERNKEQIMEDIFIKDDIMNQIKERAGGNSIVIYGAGSVGKVLAHRIMNNGCAVDCFIDNYSCEQEWMGIPVLKNCELDGRDRGKLIVISLCGDEQRVTEQLKKLKYCNIVTISRLSENQKSMRCERE